MNSGAKIIQLSELKAGQQGRIVRIDGGAGMHRHLESLGIYPGALIRKKSALFGKGPSIVSVAGSNIAIGYGKSARIWVEVIEN